jgi:hypothetical protein
LLHTTDVSLLLPHPNPHSSKILLVHTIWNFGSEREALDNTPFKELAKLLTTSVGLHLAMGKQMVKFNSSTTVY